MPQTIFVSGASGFIAKHIVLQLLEKGHTVRGSVRSAQRAEELENAMRHRLGPDSRLIANLQTVLLDLNADDGWNDAMVGVDVLMHTASPYNLELPKNDEELVRPAVDGTLRALKAAKNAGVKRVILTSSVMAVIAKPLAKGKSEYTEYDWSELDSPKLSAYDKSKTMAEKAAWNFAKVPENNIDLTCINPSLVLGTPVGGDYGASLELIERLMRGKDPAVPNTGFGVVDVKDVATAHIAAMETPESIGERIIVTAGWLWFAELTQILKEAFPDCKVPTRQAPDWLIKIIAIFDPTVRQVIPHLGQREAASNAKARKILGMEFKGAEQCVVESGGFIHKSLNQKA